MAKKEPQSPISIALRRPGQALPDNLDPLFKLQPKQEEVLLREEDEILGGGGKGSGKTQLLTAFMIAGNPRGDPSILVNQSYVYHPWYRGLVLRRNRDDMDDWLAFATKIYESMGGVYNKSDWVFEFPLFNSQGQVLRSNGGARIRVGHLAEENSYMKYQGMGNLHRIGIDEVCQIPSFALYNHLISGLRTAYPELRPQILLTANPIGPGLPWVNNRFRKAINPKTGRYYLPGETITEEIYNPITKRYEKLTRTFIFMTIWDNPALLEQDPRYLSRLMALPEPMRSAYLEGDWDALSGSQYFPMFRPSGPLKTEPPTANHCVPSTSTTLLPWYPKWAAMDWGYNHPGVCYWGCENQDDRRVYIYREKRQRYCGSRQWGVDIALASLPELRQMQANQIPPTLLLYLSQDAFFQRDAEKTYAEQIREGIKEVFGDGNVYLLPPSPKVPDGEEDHSLVQSADDLFSRLQFQTQASIAILPVPRHQRVAGFQYVRELMNWKPLVDFIPEKFDRDLAVSILYGKGQEEYVKYINTIESQAKIQPVLPQLRIFSDQCPYLIQCLPTMVFDEDGEEMLKVNADPETGLGGDDEADALRYLLVAYKTMKIKEPFQQYWQRQFSLLPSGLYTGNDIARIHDRQEALYYDRSGSQLSVNIPRRSGWQRQRWSAGKGPGRRWN